jgi:hypothetical protein
MRYRHFLALFAATLALGAATGCGNNGGTGGSGGSGATGGAGGSGGTGGSTTTTTKTNTTTSTTSTTTSSTATGDGNESFDQAVEITVDDMTGVQADLDPVATDVDYFKFTGKKGQAIFIATDSKPNATPFDPSYPDLVITVYDANKNQYAQDDDPFPRSTQDSSLPTVLPADGTYYIKVEEFCHSDLAMGKCPPDYFDNITNTGYAIGISTLDPAQPGNVNEKEPNDDAATAGKMTYAPVQGKTGQYYLTLTWGDFKAGDKDFYLMHIPKDVTMALQPNTRTAGGAAFYPAGISGDGASTSAVLVDFIDPMDMSVVAEIDASKGAQAEPPLQADKDYLIVVNGTNMGANPFYFFNHSVGGSNPLEAEGAAQGVNDTMPEVLPKPQNNMDGTYSYFIEGNLPQGGAEKDVDEFQVDTKGLATVSVACGAARSGSGLQGFKITVLNGATPVGTGTEGADKDLVLQSLAVPAGATNLVVKLEATGQSPTVKSDFYRCGIHFAPAM